MVDLVVVGLLVLVILLLVALLVRGGQRPDNDQIVSRLSRSLQDSGLNDQVARLEENARRMQEASTDLQNLFRLRPERGAAGEFQLEQILGDLLPADRFNMRMNLPQVGTPDAVVRTRQGFLIIDSKFPLDAYRDAANALDDASRAAADRRLRNAVRGHVESVATKYVRAAAGTLPFVILFVPSEAVLAYALRIDPGLLREASAGGVLLAGPTTLAAHMVIVAAGVQADHLSESADRVRLGLMAIKKRFDALRSEWDTLTRHIGNAHDKVGRVEGRIEELETAFRRTVEVDEPRLE